MEQKLDKLSKMNERFRKAGIRLRMIMLVCLNLSNSWTNLSQFYSDLSQDWTIRINLWKISKIEKGQSKFGKD